MGITTNKGRNLPPLERGKMPETPDFILIFKSFYIVGCTFLGLWGLWTVIIKMKKTNDEEVQRRAKWDEMAQIVEENKDKWNRAFDATDNTREELEKKYDDRLDDMDSKIQQLYAMNVLLIKSENALLEDRIKENGSTTLNDVHREINNFVVEQLGQ